MLSGLSASNLAKNFSDPKEDKRKIRGGGWSMDTESVDTGSHLHCHFCKHQVLGSKLYSTYKKNGPLKCCCDHSCIRLDDCHEHKCLANMLKNWTCFSYKLLHQSDTCLALYLICRDVKRKKFNIILFAKIDYHIAEVTGPHFFLHFFFMISSDWLMASKIFSSYIWKCLVLSSTKMFLGACVYTLAILLPTLKQKSEVLNLCVLDSKWKYIYICLYILQNTDLF